MSDAGARTYVESTTTCLSIVRARRKWRFAAVLTLVFTLDRSAYAQAHASANAPESADASSVPSPVGDAASASGRPVPIAESEGDGLDRVAISPPRVVQFTLPNGLTVWLSEAHDRAEVFGAVVVRAGSKDDPSDDTGMAHYLEHMLFKGTTDLGTTDFGVEAPLLEEMTALYEQLRNADEAERRKIHERIDAISQRAGQFAIPNELDRLLAEYGGVNVNAFTHPDMTVYHNSFASSQIEKWLEIYAHRFEQPVFRLFPTELEAVYEEKNRAIDSFFEAAYDGFMRAFFPHHPYGTQTTLGTVDHLRRPSLRAMRAFFEQHYVANQMALVLVGDFDVETVRPIVEQTFGRWRSGSSSTQERGTVEAFEGTVRETIRATPIRAGAIAFRTPTMGHDDYAATRVALQLFANEQGTGFLDRLVDRGRLLGGAALALDFKEHNGTILVFVPRLLTQSLRGAEGLILDELRRLREAPLDPARVDAIARNLVRDAQLAWEDNQQRALLMTDVFARGLDWSAYQAYVRDLGNISVDDVSAVLREYFADDILIVRSRMRGQKRGRLEKPNYTPVIPEEGRVSTFATALRQAPTPPPQPKYVDFDGDIGHLALGPGLDLLSTNNPANDVETIEIRFGIGRYDVPELELLGDYLERAGTETASGPEFKQGWANLTTRFEAYATPESFVLKLQAPESFVEPALRSIRTLLENPARDGTRLRRLRRENWARERVLRRDPTAVAQALWEHAVYGEYSMHRRYGARAQRRWSAKDLLTAWDRAQEHAVTVRYVGRRDPALVGSWVKTVLGLESGRPRPATEQRVRSILANDEPSVYFVKRPGAVQTHLWFYVKGESVPLPSHPAMEAFDAYLGGNMGGLVFQEVREYRALAYAAQGGYRFPERPGSPGHTYAYVACQADKTQETLELLRTILTDLPRKADRMPSLRSSLIHAQEGQDPHFRELAEQVQDWRWQGYSEDPRRNRIESYDDLDFAAIEAFWREHVANRPIVLMVLGDPRQIPQTVLEQFGEVEVVRMGRLYH